MPVELQYWAAVCGAILVKLIASPRQSVWAVIASVIVALFAATVFTPPTLAFWQLNADTYEIPVAVLWALTGENAVKLALSITSSWERVIELVKLAMGRGK